MRSLLLVGAIALVLAGCAYNTKNQASPSDQSHMHGIEAEQTIPNKPEITDAPGVADRLEQLATSIPGVQGATCVVVGNTAIVGINVKGNLDRSRVGTLKYSVAEALRKDPYGVHAIVTADLDMRNRLLEIRQDIRAGKPISGFANELSDMIGRIMPQLPKSVQPRAEQGNQRTDRNKLRNKSL